MQSKTTDTTRIVPSQGAPTNLVVNINLNSKCGEITEASPNTANTIEPESLVSDKQIILKVLKLENRKHLWSQDGVRKERSPMVSSFLKHTGCTPTIDEGSEINCVDAAFAKKAEVLYMSTKCTATAAGSVAMNVVGQTSEDVVLQIPHNTSKITWNLGKCIIVENLGVEILIGEPAKIDNKIVTKSHLKIIETLDDDGKLIKIPYFNRNDEKRHLCKVTQTKILCDKDSFKFKLPAQFHRESHIAIAPIKNNLNFIQPRVLEVNEDNTIDIHNDSGAAVTIKKNFCFAEITSLRDADSPSSCNKVCSKPVDYSHLKKPL